MISSINSNLQPSNTEGHDGCMIDEEYLAEELMTMFPPSEFLFASSEGEHDSGLELKEMINQNDRLTSMYPSRLLNYSHKEHMVNLYNASKRTFEHETRSPTAVSMCAPSIVSIDAEAFTLSLIGETELDYFKPFPPKQEIPVLIGSESSLLPEMQQSSSQIQPQEVHSNSEEPEGDFPPSEKRQRIETSNKRETSQLSLERRRERNRRHARLSREKKKETLKSMQLQISESKRENELLRQILIKALGMDQAEILLKENNLTLDSSDGPHGDATSTCDSSSNGVDEPDDYTEINS